MTALGFLSVPQTRKPAAASGTLHLRFVFAWYIVPSRFLNGWLLNTEVPNQMLHIQTALLYFKTALYLFILYHIDLLNFLKSLALYGIIC